MWTQFLKWFRTLFARSRGAEPREFVTETGEVARFVFRARDLDKSGNPKPGAFAPEMHPELNRWETSVCGRDGVSDSRLWELGQTIRPGMQCIASIEVATADVRRIGLDCVAAPEPNFAEHGVIIGWHAEKDRRLLAQQDLVVARRRVLTPPPAAGT